jgi:anaerobic magnesium-protoporphyrin IX monomethyl ester cyclase
MEMSNKYFKFTLISPYSSISSYGVRSISTFLKGKGITVSTIYMPNSFSSPYDNSIFDRLTELCSDSDLIGISVMSNYFINCAQISNEIRRKLSVPIVWGGVHPTLSPEECLEHCDIAVMGEGELTLLEIINNLRGNMLLHAIPGTCVRYDGKANENPPRLPMRADDLVSIEHDYSSDRILINGKFSKMNYGILKNYITGDYMTLSSFGCPYNCSYCVNNQLKKFCGSTTRFRKIDNIIRELVSAREKMDFIRHISFDDDAFILRNVDELKEFGKEYKENINLPFFVSGIHPMLITEEKLAILISAGMDRVRMGIQTGSRKIKAIYNRHIPDEKILSAAKIINKFRRKLILTGYDLILDNPFETKEDVIETIRLLSKLPAPFTLNLFSLTFYPGTDIYREALQAGFVKDNVEDIYKKHYLDIGRTYLNLIIAVYTIFKIPKWLLNCLLNEKFVNSDIRIPKTIFGLIIFLGNARRAVSFLIKGDPYTLLRHLKFSLNKT